MPDEIETEFTQFGAVYGPAVPEFVVHPDQGEIILRGIPAALVNLAINEMQTCGRTPAVDEACGDLVQRLCDYLANQVPSDEHEGSRPGRFTHAA